MLSYDVAANGRAENKPCGEAFAHGETRCTVGVMLSHHEFGMFVNMG